jgi:hypothetical protein
MSRSAQSILVFGCNLMVIGLLFLIAPNIFLRLTGLSDTDNVWIHLSGMLLLIMSFYYIMAARTGKKAFFRWTIYTRLGAIFVLMVFVQTGLIGPVVYLFWLGDLAGVIWTARALKLEGEWRL